MREKNLSIAEAYYDALGKKDMEKVEQYLHPDVECIGPLVKVTGKGSVLEANKKFISLFKTLKIRSSFASGDQSMIVYDLEFAASVDVFSSAVLLTLSNDLISKIELFYDPRPFVHSTASA